MRHTYTGQVNRLLIIAFEIPHAKIRHIKLFFSILSTNMSEINSMFKSHIKIIQTRGF